jgi:hypothetical protein
MSDMVDQFGGDGNSVVGYYDREDVSLSAGEDVSRVVCRTGRERQ